MCGESKIEEEYSGNSGIQSIEIVVEVFRVIFLPAGFGLPILSKLAFSVGIGKLKNAFMCGPPV